MDFALEEEMLPIVKKWLRPQVTSMETELGCGYCGVWIPDIVGICFDLDKVSKLVSKGPTSGRQIKRLIKERMHTEHENNSVYNSFDEFRQPMFLFFRACFFSH